MNYKKIINTTLLTCALIGFSSVPRALGQENGRSDNTIGGFGIHGGLNFSNDSYNNSNFTFAKNNRTEGMAGLHYEGITLGFFGLRLEANYSVTGYQFNPYLSVTRRSLQIPVLFKIEPYSESFVVFVEAGASASIPLSTRIEYQTYSASYDEGSNNIGYGILGGLGIGYKLDNALVELEGRYEYGLNNLSDLVGVDIKSRTFQLVAGITFLM